MQKLAYGLLNMKPYEFWQLDMKEYHLMLDGYYMREEKEWEKLSHLASWITMPHVKNSIKPTDFYDPNRSKKKETTPEESQQIIDELMSEMDTKI
jgi:hypothetical protein